MFMRDCYIKKKLSQNTSCACAEIYGIHRGAHSNILVKYSFYLNGKKTLNHNINSELLSYGNSIERRFIGKKYPVIFNTLDTEYCKILMDARLLNDYNLTKEDWNNCVDSSDQIK